MLNKRDYVFLKHQEINKQKWDSIINQCFNSKIYGSSKYLDIISPNWNAFVHKDWNWVFPIPSKKKHLIPIIIQPTFCQQLGFFRKTPTTDIPIDSIISDLNKKYPFIVYRFLVDNSVTISRKLIKRTTYILPLKDNYEINYKNFSSSHKKNLKRSKKSDTSIIESEDYKTLVDLIYDMYSEKKLGDVKNKNFNALLNLFKLGIKNPQTKFYYVTNSKNKIIAGACFMNYHNQYLLFSGSNAEGYSSKSTFALVNHFIFNHSSLDAYLDFSGSDIKGIAEFNKGWGAQLQEYYEYYNHWLKLL